MQQTRKPDNINSAYIYKETTQPLQPQPMKSSADKPAGKNRRDKSDLGSNFVAPDGGWAWLVCMAAGFSNLSIYPCLQQFGFIFRERLHDLGMNTSQVTSIINISSAVSASTGIFNAPMFRRYSFRQLAIVGALLVFLGIMLCAFCETFTSYLICFSVLFGIGKGINMSASSMAINTYFKRERRKAHGFAWTITGFGPIVFPHIATLLLFIYGIQGTIFLFAAIALHSLVCALIFQPVKYHVKPQPQPLMELKSEQKNDLKASLLCKYCEQKQLDAEVKSGLDAMDVPISTHANEDQFCSKTALSSKLELTEQSKTSENRCTCEQRPLVQQQQSAAKLKTANIADDKQQSQANKSFFKKVVDFFDWDLLRDITFVNIIFGLTIINFAELNFSIFTPFILHDFGFSTAQAAMAMSTMATVDISSRFLVPFITAKLNWDNRVFFLLGIMGIVVGRTIVACSRSFAVILGACAWMGICKGFRTVFVSLILPGYVPLKRLPAASGMQLLVSGLFTMLSGPFVGLIRDNWDYSVTLHCLNAMTCLAAGLWGLEALVRHLLRRSEDS